MQKACPSCGQLEAQHTGNEAAEDPLLIQMAD
jgi:hypothetical protein